MATKLWSALTVPSTVNTTVRQPHLLLLLLASLVLFSGSFVIDQAFRWSNPLEGIANGVLHVVSTGVGWLVYGLVPGLIANGWYRWRGWRRFRSPTHRRGGVVASTLAIGTTVAGSTTCLRIHRGSRSISSLAAYDPFPIHHNAEALDLSRGGTGRELKVSKTGEPDLQCVHKPIGISNVLDFRFFLSTLDFQLSTGFQRGRSAPRSVAPPGRFDLSALSSQLSDGPGWFSGSRGEVRQL